MCSGDRTSISLDMARVHSKQGCWAYSSSGKLTWTFHHTTHIEFNAEWSDCTNVWFAPLWITPSHWKSPQGTSGEIDLIESCRKHQHDTVGTSIICRDHPDPQCLEPQWGDARSSNGPKHFRAQIDGRGTWTMEMCNIDRSNCKLVSRYPYYMSKAKGAQQHMQYSFMSDLYNGGAGDAGWKNCGTLNYKTQCKYTVGNIKVYSVLQAPNQSSEIVV